MSDVKTKIIPNTFQPTWIKNCAAWYDANRGVTTTGWNSQSITWTGTTGVSTTSNSITDTFGGSGWG